MLRTVQDFTFDAEFKLIRYELDSHAIHDDDLCCQCLAMLPENVSELLKREESLQIDILTEVDSAPQMKPTQYISTSSTNDDTSFAGSLRCSSMLQSSVGSKISMNSWMQALMSAEKGSVMYSDDYCTLSHAIIEHAVKTHKI